MSVYWLLLIIPVGIALLGAWINFWFNSQSEWGVPSFIAFAMALGLPLAITIVALSRFV